MIWWNVAMLVFSLVLSYLLRPTPENENAAPKSLEEDDVPFAESGKEIPVLFGRRWLKAPNVVWYGDVRTEAIKSKSGK